MNFDFSDEQKQFRGQVAKLLQQHCPLAVCRNALEGKVAFADALWRELTALGFQGAVIPQEFGGAAAGYLELCIAAEEIGRNLAPIPSLSSVYVCSEAIHLFGSEQQKARWLPSLANGTTLGTWASSERAGELAGESIRCTFEAGRLHGTKLPVLDGMLARPCVVLARDKQGRCRLLLCDLEGEGTERDRIDSIDPSQPVARVRFAGTPAEELGRSLDGLADYGNLINRAAILLAFEQIGAADRALWMARDYALDRRAFGRPIGANQAIKHKLTMVYQRNEVARAHAYYGAWALSTESPELLLAAAGARLAATEALCFAAQENIQTHGGIGFTWESDCQLFYRRARFCALALGGTAQWQEQAMRALERKQEAEAAGGF